MFVEQAVVIVRHPDWAFIEMLPFGLSILALVTFAGWLNWRVGQLNKPCGKARQAAVEGVVP
jgi:hypothetical protein